MSGRFKNRAYFERFGILAKGIFNALKFVLTIINKAYIAFDYFSYYRFSAVVVKQIWMTSLFLGKGEIQNFIFVYNWKMKNGKNIFRN